MHSDLFDICRALRRRGIRVTLLSTGLLLHRYAEQITAHVNDVIVSLDGPPAVHDTIRRVPGAFTILQEGIRRLLEIDPAFPISARCVAQQLNHGQLIQTAACAQALGLRSISFLAADLTSEAFNRPNGWPQLQQQQIALTPDQLDVLADQFRQISQRWNGSGFVLESPDKLQRIIDHFSAHLGLCAPQSPRCNAPWTSAVVEADGSVRPCFFHPPIGSLKHLALSQILNGPQAIAFRHSLDVGSNPICQRCVCSLNWKRAGVQETSCS